ncbi:DUF302 domain-containing protein [Denitromonas ohlonensis]|uniref:DUF302 domain-containing protein n=2 Tax=Denitromonas TaxID=139331 RepID=A0A557RL79_9RHOO|nr:DUF302 domain-containing protein [Denitromonas ohlonensis]TVO65931.1 DUF302 domain-containing protein [Denitromonas ohlonensis]TVO79524.1 DUF302 domain-containing protein [Denitromonas ohlonensis]
MPRFVTALAIALALNLMPVAHADDIVHQRLNTSDYTTARIAVTDAIIDEGLRVASVSNFGEMLARTDADLHHGATPYRHAEVFAFCSIQVAALLVSEAPERIAYCPLTIALYQLVEEPGHPVHILFHPPGGQSPGALAGLDVLNRIVGRVQQNFPPPN